MMSGYRPWSWETAFPPSTAISQTGPFKKGVLNPKTHWTFSSEDFVGKMSILTASVSPGVSSTRLSLKVAPKYRILLHFLLTREGMQEAGMNIDP